MRKNPLEYYRALGLNPGATADEIKQAYRRLLQTWHPDHFKTGSLMQTTAEDVTKEINEAYEQLLKKQLYKKFLPPPAATAVPPFPSRAAAAYQSAGSSATQNPPSPTSAKPPRGRRPPPPIFSRPPRRPDAARTAAAPRSEFSARRFVGRWRLSHRGLIYGCLFLLAGVLPFLIRENPSGLKLPASPILIAKSASAKTAEPGQIISRVVQPEPRQIQLAQARSALDGEPRPREPAARSRPAENSTTPAAAFFPSGFLEASRLGDNRQAEAPELAVARREDAAALLDTFEVGDFKGKVLAVQGAPDDIGENVFRYGAALVYFENGRVTSWLDRFSRLRVRERPVLEFIGLDSFSVGATRADVWRAQGAPTEFTRDGYYYGPAAVYFHDDLVAGWSDAGLRLHTR